MKNKLFLQILRFGFVGGTAFLIDAGILYILTEFFDIHYLIANVISFAISTIYNYILSILFVFDTKKKGGGLQATVFVILSIVGLMISQLLMWIFVDLFFISTIIAKIISTIIVMCFNFITRKFFLEKA